MRECHELIPPPPVIRDRLARNIRERRLLRGLLRLSIKAATDGQDAPMPHEDGTARPSKGGAR